MEETNTMRDPRTDPRVGDVLFAPGWLDEQIAATTKEVASWPTWMQQKTWARDAQIIKQAKEGNDVDA